MSDLQTKQQNINWLDALRIAAALAVIVLHVSSQGWHQAAVDSADWRVFNACLACVRWAVPVFVMISGSLFLDPERNVSIRSLYRKNLPRILCAFCFWSAVYTAYAKWRDPGLRPLYVVNKLLQGQYHMWFLFMIAGLYVVTPMLRRVTEDKKLTEYFLLVAFFSVFVFSTAGILADFYLPGMESERLTLAVTALRSDWAKAAFFLPLGFSAYYVAGYYLRRWSLSAGAKVLVFAASLAGFAATVLVSEHMTAAAGAATGFDSSYSLNVMAEALGVFLLFRELGGGAGRRAKKGPSGQKKALKAFSRWSFGAYLVHVLFLEGISDLLGIRAISMPAHIAVPALAGVIALCSFAVSAIINLIPGLKGHIV